MDNGVRWKRDHNLHWEPNLQFLVPAFHDRVSSVNGRHVDSDRAVGLDEVLHAFILLEEDWERFGNDWTMRLQAVLTAMVLVGGFSGALRGEELPKMELGAIRKYWDEAVHHPRTPHVPMVLSG
jgi:hypothetical protein